MGFLLIFILSTDELPLQYKCFWSTECILSLPTVFFPSWTVCKFCDYCFHQGESRTPLSFHSCRTNTRYRSLVTAITLHTSVCLLKQQRESKLTEVVKSHPLLLYRLLHDCRRQSKQPKRILALSEMPRHATLNCFRPKQ